jgi:hypothetical protein
MLFVAEPLILHGFAAGPGPAEARADFRLVEWLHRVLLFVGLITILGAVAGSYGLLLFE